MTKPNKSIVRLIDAYGWGWYEFELIDTDAGTTVKREGFIGVNYRGEPWFVLSNWINFNAHSSPWEYVKSVRRITDTEKK